MRRAARLLLGLAPLASVAAVAVLLSEESDPAAARGGACVREFGPLPGLPGGLTAGKDGRLWFSEQLQDRIGSYDPRTRRVREIPVPGGTSPHFMATGPDGTIWFSGLGDRLGRVDPATGEVELIAAGISPGSMPHAVAPAPDGRHVYFTQQEGGSLGRFEVASRRVVELSAALPPVSRPHGLALDPGKRHLWVALQGADRLARFDLARQRFDRFVRFSAGSGPHDVRVGPDGRTLYVTLQQGSRLGEYDPRTGAKREYPAPLPRPSVTDLEPGAKLVDVIASPTERAVWITTFMAGALLRFDVDTKRFAWLRCGITPGSATLEVANGPDGRIWFTEPIGARLARLDE
ncbi:MAG: beta-propeller fold lactonase family protein [Thermoleophilia bacterium]|nr:beta-propeller fold lactonase family protein [Thermoleophilia bacterium]